MIIPADAIDHDRARDLGHDGADGEAEGLSVLFSTRPLAIFAVRALFFHFANAPLLRLDGQKLAPEFPKDATAMLLFCMVAAQGVMLPIAIMVGRNADRLGRRPIFLIALSVLPIRAALYALSDNVCWPLGDKLLESVGAGVCEALTPLVIGDVMRGAGRHNLAQGAVATGQGIDATISALAAGEATDLFGCSASFLFQAAAAAVAWAVFALLLPETRDAEAIGAERVGATPGWAPGQ